MLITTLRIYIITSNCKTISRNVDRRVSTLHILNKLSKCLFVYIYRSYDDSSERDTNPYSDHRGSGLSCPGIVTIFANYKPSPIIKKKKKKFSLDKKL